MSLNLNSPLPGDLVIGPQQDSSGLRATTVYVVTVWPGTESVGGPYQSYGYALSQARQLAQRRNVQLWREHSADSSRSQLENVSL